MFEANYPTDNVFKFRAVPIKFGLGALGEIFYDLKSFNAKKVLVVTDEYLSSKTNVVKSLVSILSEHGIQSEVWAGVEPEPSDTSIISGINFCKDLNFDVVVGLGGGSSIDTAKLINLYTTFEADFYTYFAPPIGLGKEIPGRLKPLIAIPTTSGTGSEVTGVAVVTFKERWLKFGISHEYLVPSLAILDPILTLTMPPTTTANTGIDALMHAIEAYTTRSFDTRIKPEDPSKRPVYQGSTPLTDSLAELAIKYISKYLLRAYINGIDLEARSYMHLAAHIAGIAFANAGVHIPHALSYPLATLCMKKNIKLSHGLAVGVFGPSTLKALSHYLPEKCQTISKLLFNFTPDCSVKPDNAWKALTTLLKLLKFPNGLTGLGITEDDVDVIAEEALAQKRLLAQSPMTVSKDLLKEIVEGSMRFW